MLQRRCCNAACWYNDDVLAAASEMQALALLWRSAMDKSLMLILLANVRAACMCTRIYLNYAHQASPQELQYSPQWRQLITALATVLVSVC
jgi:uncharacterized protein involved in cysteine biosynthesis